MLFADIIQKKRDGSALSDEEIGAFVTGMADGSLPGEQVAAMAMAIFFKGMDFAETGALTKAMAGSGVVIDWGDTLDGPVVDKHSTGGIGDNVSLMLAPIAAACGLFVPMISGRGLAHTGGTLDKMAAIPGYRVTPDLDTFRKVVREVGCAIIGQTGDLAPADARLYAVRSITATVESFPLINGSILSKKLAAGNTGLVMDIKTGSGAFMRTSEDARTLARSLIGTGAHCGLTVHALITDMSEALGRDAGNAVEVAEAVAFLRCEDREPRLNEVVLELAAEMQIVGGVETDRDKAMARAEAAVCSGKAAEIFARMVAELGGPADFMERFDSYLPVAPVIRPVFPERPGYLAAVEAKDIGNAIIGLGGGRLTTTDEIDPAVGFTGFAPIGSEVGPDRPLAFVNAASEAAADRAASALRAACLVSESLPPVTRVIHERIT